MSTLRGASLQNHIRRWKGLTRRDLSRGKVDVAADKTTLRDALADMLKTAIELEFATIPPYLCALWSIKDELHPVASSLREIMQEEMLHLGLICNMLAAIGECPPIQALAPSYPSGLPGDVHPGLKIRLQGLNKESLKTFMQIEAPAELAKSVPHEEGDPEWPNVRTIGEFYGCVAAAFEKYVATGGAFHLENQVSASLVWRVIGSLDDVETAIRIITTQGEGAVVKGGSITSPRDSGRNDYAHYYRFLEMWKEKRLVRLDEPHSRTERYAWRGVYKLPDCHQMGPVPENGYLNCPPEVQQLLADFQGGYHKMLELLESAWKPGGQGRLVHAIAKMFELSHYAKHLMAIRCDEKSDTTYGPTFMSPAVRQ